MVNKQTKCLSCGNNNLVSVLDYGKTPLADRLLTADQLEEPELTAPLEWVFCPDCRLMQITELVDPEMEHHQQQKGLLLYPPSNLF